jgi:fibronectin type 3 domain-containing protein
MSSSTVTMSWNSSSGATYYDFGVRDMNTNQLVVDTTTTNTSYTAGLSAGTPYRWNVAACNSAGCSSFTTSLYFQTPGGVSVPSKPTGTSPGSTSSPGPTMSSSTVTMSWNSSSGATYYDFGVRDMNTNQLVVDTTTTNTSYTASLSAGTPYRWNVAACNSAGCSSFTTLLYFQTPGGSSVPSKPTGTSPGSTSSPGPTMSSSTVTMSWNASSGATYYDFGVRDMTTNQLVVDTTTSNTFYTANLSPGRTYRWNVAACNSAGCSSFTTALYFKTP